MTFRNSARTLLILTAFLFPAGCGPTAQVKKDAVGSIKKVAIVGLYCPAAITNDNQRQAIGFHVVDAAVQAKRKRDDRIKAFRPRGLMLLGKAQDAAIAGFSKAFGWRISPVSAAPGSPSYRALKEWSDANREKLFAFSMGPEGTAFLWADGKDTSLNEALAKFCAAAGVDAVMLLSFDFAYTKGPWKYKDSFPSARTRTFTGVQMVDRSGNIILSTPRADERKRDFSEMADTTIPLKGWTADINDDTVKTFDSATKKSVEKVTGLLKQAMRTH